MEGYLHCMQAQRVKTQRTKRRTWSPSKKLVLGGPRDFKSQILVWQTVHIILRKHSSFMFVSQQALCKCIAIWCTCSYERWSFQLLLQLKRINLFSIIMKEDLLCSVSNCVFKWWEFKCWEYLHSMASCLPPGGGWTFLHCEFSIIKAPLL